MNFEDQYLEPKGFGLVINMHADQNVVYERSVWKRKNPETGEEHNSRDDAINDKLKKIEGYEETETKILNNY